jgi:hypothetical protein
MTFQIKKATIARRFGVTDVMVSKIRRGVAWRHVGGNA